MRSHGQGELRQVNAMAAMARGATDCHGKAGRKTMKTRGKMPLLISKRSKND
jgi:hypothetical protein